MRSVYGYWRNEVGLCRKRNRDSRLFHPDHLRRHLPRFVRHAQPSHAPGLWLCIRLLILAAFLAVLQDEWFLCALPIVVGMGVGLSFARHRWRREAYQQYARTYSADPMKICHQCGYDLRASSGGHCPECGARMLLHNVSASRPGDQQ